MQTLIIELNQEDIVFLKKQFRKFKIVVFVTCCTMLLMAVYFFYQNLLSYKAFTKNVFPVFIFLFLGVILSYCGFQIALYSKAIFIGKKEVLIGILTKKEGANESAPSKTMKTRFFEVFDDYLFLDDQKIGVVSSSDSLDASVKIIMDVYHKAKIGQTLAVERTLFRKYFLKLEILNENS